MNFGERVKTERERLGLSQAELAKRMNISQQAVAKYEKIVEQPKLATISKIAEALEIPIATLVMDWGLFSSSEIVTGWKLGNNAEERLIKCFQYLNDKGKEKLLDYALDLTKITEYTDEDTLTLESKE